MYTQAGLSLWNTQTNKSTTLSVPSPNPSEKEKPPQVTGGPAVMGSVAFSPDEKQLYCAADKALTCWGDAASEALLWQGCRLMSGVLGVVANFVGRPAELL